MAGIFTFALEYAAPVFLVASPVLSYSDQIYSIHRTKSSAGFSMDITLIMLVASIFKVFYWFGAYYSFPLLLQAISMIAVQITLLKVALENRPQPGMKDGIEHAPFSGFSRMSESGFARPYNFWQWKTTRPYWTFLLYLSVSLFAIRVLLPAISHSEAYITTLGFVGLGVEAFLPIPQIISNQRARSCKGFRLSVLVAWLLGDTMKMSYFFFSGSSVPLAFRVCGVLQCLCDCYLALQYGMYGDGSSSYFTRSSTNAMNGNEHWAMKETDVRLA